MRDNTPTSTALNIIASLITAMEVVFQEVPRRVDASPSPEHALEMPDHLQNLPQELLEAIAQFLPREDLFNLRLTSTEMASRTTSLMARTYFRDIHLLMMDPGSMFRLIAVLTHPVFKKAIRVIMFNTAVLEDKQNKYYTHLDEPGEEGWKTWITTPLQQKAYDLHIQFRPLAKTFTHCILELCHRAGVAPEIKTIQGGLRPPDSQGPWGVKELKSTLGQDRLICSHRMEQEAYGMLLHGIFSSDFEITRLALGHHRSHFDPWMLVEAMAEFKRWEPFTHLTHLDLNLKEQTVWPWERNVPARLRDIEAHVTSIFWMIAQAESLESLVLACQCDYISEDRRLCDTVFFSALVHDHIPGFKKPLSSIKHLTLEGHEIPKQMLLDFVRDHQSTLRSLDLWEIIDGKLDDTAMKQDLFEAARGIADFKLKMGRVYEGTRPAVYSNHEGWALPQWESLDSEGRVRTVE